MRRLSSVLVAALFLLNAGLVSAFDSGNNPGATGSNTITWTGQGASNGVLNSPECPSKDAVPSGIDANSYLHWIFTTDGGSADTSATLHLGTTAGGNQLGDFTTSKDSGGAFHFFTPYYSPTTTTLFAYVSFTVLTTGNGSWNLVISHGCSGGVNEADDLTVTKDATGSYDNTYTWDIDKSADGDEILTAGGADGSMDYKVTVSDDDGVISNVNVSGTITVTNPNGANVTLTSISDTLSDETVCDVEDDSDLTIEPGSNEYTYSCDLDALPEGPLTNHVEIAWGEQTLSDNSHLAASSAEFDSGTIGFTGNNIDDCITVNDTNAAGPQDEEVCAADAPVDFEYTGTISGDTGTCTDNDNTASFEANDTEQSGEAKWTVTDCQGADLTVEKTADAGFTRTWTWDITKDVDKTTATVDQGGNATFNYTVNVTHDSGTDSDYVVTGTITVTNPNDWQDIDADVSDAVDNGGTCLVEDEAVHTVTVPMGDSVELDYACTYAAAPSDAEGTNTATAEWGATAASTPNGSDTGTADFEFTDPTTLVDDCVNVTDDLKGALGEVCFDDASPTEFKYSLTFQGPAWGTCVSKTNTATITETGDSDSETVRVCSYNQPLTQGYWRNHLNPISATCKSNAGCSNNGPWTVPLLGTSICQGSCVAGKLSSTYTVTTQPQVVAVFDANNCSNASTSDSNAAACLAAQLLAAELNVANGANPCICSTIQQAKAALTAVGYTGPGFKATLPKNGVTRAQLISLKTALDNYNNGKGCPA